MAIDSSEQGRPGVGASLSGTGGGAARPGEPGGIPLGRDRVDVWHASLDGAAELPLLAATLSTDERARADRFRFERDRARFVAARGLLRVIAGKYVGRDPASLRFSYGVHGKPALAEDDLRFSVAHAGEFALYALAHGREVGVDIERVRTDLDLDLLASTVLTPSERAAIGAVAPEDRPALFFAVWTFKEAFVKALGTGLAFEFARIEVAFGRGGEPTLVVDGEPVAPDRWVLRSLDPAEGYGAALAVEGDGWRLARGAWPEDAVARDAGG